MQKRPVNAKGKYKKKKLKNKHEFLGRKLLPHKSNAYINEYT